MSAPRRWPLFLIAAPAAVAVWSGWVGLGGLCGFGVVHPLPGIAPGFELNTAITLPVGVEAYGAYALGAWLTPGTPDGARRFARRSALGALGARHGRAGDLPPAGRRARHPRAVAGRGPGLVPAGRDAGLRRRADAPAALSRTRRYPAPVTTYPSTLAEAARVFAAEVAAGTVPTVRAIRSALSVGQAKASQARAYLAVLASEVQP